MTNSQNDYFVLTWRSGNGETPWNWQICRRSIPMGVHICASGYTNRMSAKAAGTKALTDLLRGIEDDLRKSQTVDIRTKSRRSAVKDFPVPALAAEDGRKRVEAPFARDRVSRPASAR